MILLLIVLLGFVLRVISLDQSLWLDEATSVLVARDFSFSEILTKFSPGDFHPPFYYLLLKTWISFFGSSEIAVRIMSIFFGVATIWVVYKIAQKLLTKNCSLIVALFLATAPLHVYYSQETRAYVMETLLGAVVAYCVVLIFQSSKPKALHYLAISTLAYNKQSARSSFALDSPGRSSKFSSKI